MESEEAKVWKTVEAEGECIVSRPRKVGPYTGQGDN